MSDIEKFSFCGTGLYYCKNCDLNWEFEIEKSTKKKKSCVECNAELLPYEIIPYAGPIKGYFQCKIHKSKWSSFCVWYQYGQECIQCNQSNKNDINYILPYKTSRWCGGCKKIECQCERDIQVSAQYRCRKCKINWKETTILYFIGRINKKRLKQHIQGGTQLNCNKECHCGRIIKPDKNVELKQIYPVIYRSRKKGPQHLQKLCELCQTLKHKCSRDAH